ncbi:MAG: universal stress protein [Cyanophyceae cyanobacterium]
MYNKILVAVDRTKLSRQALTQAIAIAKAFQATLHLLHVLTPLEQEYKVTPLAFSHSSYLESLDGVIREQWQSLEEAGLKMLRSHCAEVQQAGVKCESTQTIGQPDRKICELAQTWNADLIVIGSHGRKGLRELVLGSVSNYVSHHVPCAVLIVHQQADSQSLPQEQPKTAP